MTKKTLLILLLFLNFLIPLSSENIRGPVAGVVEFSEAGWKTIEASVESLVGLVLPDHITPLLQGVKITVSADSGMSVYRNSFALYFYKNLDTAPSTEVSAYKGTQTYMRFMDFGKPVSFIIPLSESHTLSPDRATFLISEKNKKGEFPLMMTILPITKGIPDDVYDQKVYYKIEPVFFNKGLLQVNVLNNEGKPVDEPLYYQIDGKIFEDLSNLTILDAGLHSLQIRTESGVEDTLEFALSSGQTMIMDHIIQQQYPTLRIDTIEGMKVFLDEKPISTEDLSHSMEILPGTHIIRFEIGDYQLSREFTAEMQDSFRITMIPEILLEKQ